MKLIQTGLVRTAICAYCAAASLAAQSLQFEVASIKRNLSGPPIISQGPFLRGGTLTALMVTPRQLLMAAWSISADRIDAPTWIDNERFDIYAKSPAGVSDAALGPMLQSLLKDRFKLAVHVEAKEMPVYNLVVAKSGIKVKRPPALEPSPSTRWDRPHPIIMGKHTMSQLAYELGGLGVGRPVVDQTGLDGEYVFTLEYAPLSVQSNQVSTELGPPDIFTALEQQLGLKLEPGKGKVDVLVVDHMERTPTDN